MKKANKAQSLLAYVILIATVVAAVLTMRAYLTRTVQEKYRQSSDTWGEGEQYDPGVTAASYKDKNKWENKKLKCPEAELRAKDMEKAIELLRKRITSLQTEMDQLNGRAKAIDEHIDQVEQEAKNLEAEGYTSEAQRLRDSIIPDLKREAADLRKKAKQREDKIPSCQEELKRLELELDSFKEQNSQCNFS